MCFGYGYGCGGKVILNEADSYDGTTFVPLARALAEDMGGENVLLLHKGLLPPMDRGNGVDNVARWWDVGDAQSMHVEEFSANAAEIMEDFTTIMTPHYGVGTAFASRETPAISVGALSAWLKQGCRRWIVGIEHPQLGVRPDEIVATLQLLRDLGIGITLPPIPNAPEPGEEYIETFGRFFQNIGSAASLNGGGMRGGGWNLDDPMFSECRNPPIFFRFCGALKGGDAAIYDIGPGGQMALGTVEHPFTTPPLESVPIVALEEYHGSEVIVVADTTAFGRVEMGSILPGFYLLGIQNRDAWRFLSNGPGPYDLTRGRAAREAAGA